MSNEKDKCISRRCFFSMVGWGGLITSMGGSAFSLFKYMKPNVLYEPPTVFKIGYPKDYKKGVSEKWKREGRFWVVKDSSGIYALISICRHLGCTPNWAQDQKKFLCPCHGSVYDIYGNVLAGPAPRVLWRPQITLDTLDKQMVVNTAIRQDPDPRSTSKGLFVDENIHRVEPFILKA
ncbi:MAG: ubiquinol-cytochrome c reductase iron-sulfur subunit [Thermodesulfobacteriota bacterium]